MNVRAALKTKAKLVKEMNEDLAIISNYNSVDEGTDRPYEVKPAFEAWLKKIEELVELKANIHRANAPVYDKIFKLSEYKSIVKQLRGIDCTSGKHKTYHHTEPTIKTAIISVVDRDKLVKEYEAKIEVLQEELDHHNTVTKI